jgi:hypothetical protein
MQWGVLDGEEHFTFPIVFPNKFVKFITFNGFYYFYNITQEDFYVEYSEHEGDFYFAFGF